MLVKKKLISERKMGFISFLRDKLFKKDNSPDVVESLNAIFRHKVPLYIDQEDVAYTIAFLITQLDVKHKNLEMKSLTPHNYQTLFAKNKIIILTTIPNSIKTIRFSCKIKNIENSELAKYTLSFPKKIENMGRRNVPRTKVSNYADLQVIVNCDRGIPALGYLYDLSRQGLGVRFDQDIRDVIKIDNIPRLCTLQINNTSYLECQIQLIHCYYDSNYLLTHAGAKFINLTTDQERKISQLITQIQLKYYQRYHESNPQDDQ